MTGGVMAFMRRGPCPIRGSVQSPFNHRRVKNHPDQSARGGSAEDRLWRVACLACSACAASGEFIHWVNALTVELDERRFDFAVDPVSYTHLTLPTIYSV